MNDTEASDWLTWQIVDSAFPTGAFAHSSGLEAAWQLGEIDDLRALERFVAASIQQAAHGVVPLVNAAYRRPSRLVALDALADAFLTNPVANRASRIQGRTLVATAARIWPCRALDDLARASERLRAHVAPLSGAAFCALGLPLPTVQRIVLFGAARSVLSAAVRLGIAGSYEAQRLQHRCGPELDAQLARCADVDEADLAQTAPLLDLIQAGHDALYSRLFQS
jgi:urease accessory protein